MAEPKPFASLTSGLLARKGAAAPAMRRQIMGGHAPNLHSVHNHDDLGWNDMGDDQARHSDPAPFAGLTPMASPSVAAPPVEEFKADPVAVVAAPVPAVVEQQRSLAEKVAAPAVSEAPVAKVASVAVARKAKTAFTLRLDAERHLRLRLACAVGNRSAQQIVTEALDEFLSSRPQIDALAEQLPCGGDTN